MTSTQIRQSFLDFFKSKQHTVVPSSSLMPDSPNLLFTNAGMNQFVPIFLGQTRCPYTPGRAADTQKCIRAGGKHNDLEDVGLDTYHHTFFEMLGNWSFGDYFKQEAIDWAWELVVQIWKFPPQRLYATVFCPYLGQQGWESRWSEELKQNVAHASLLAAGAADQGSGGPDGASPGSDAFQWADGDSISYWATHFLKAGCDPLSHIIPGNKKDNFWMMGETGPCGPCSELHVDLTPQGDTHGALVNKGSAECIEIWNLVFIQFNANPDGTFSPLPAKHVDTGMGFERVTGIIQNTKGFTDFTRVISNYETDIFRPIFDKLEQVSGKKYGSTLPSGKRLVKDGDEEKEVAAAANETEAVDVAFRVIADHIRTLSFAIADGIQPGNTDRNYVLRRILRRAVRYGRTLGFREPFFYKLVAVLAETMGEVFPEVRAKQKHVEEVIRTEEEAFNKTLDRGIEMFNEETARVMGTAPAPGAADRAPAVGSGASDIHGARYSKRHLPHFERPWAKYMVTFSTHEKRQLTPAERDIVLQSVLYAHEHRQYQLFAACVMPDHVHLLFEPQVKEQDKEGQPVFWSLTEMLQGIKSTTAHRINKAANVKGVHVWTEEYFDRVMRGDSDLEEKFHYICRNPWDNGVVSATESYRWLWTPEAVAAIGSAGAPPTAPNAQDNQQREGTSHASGVSREGAGNSARGGRAPQTAPQFTGESAFRLYDTYGFPLDLTELMARERGLTVDVEGFNKLMEEQKARARAAQKKTVIELSQIETTTPTAFVGFETLETPAKVLEVVQIKDKTAVILDTSACYAEMGGQVGDSGEILHVPVAADVSRLKLPDGADLRPLLRITNTQKSGNTWLHFVEGDDIPATGDAVVLRVDRARRAAIQRHHTVTHLLHWALHEVVSKDASQKGSFVGPDKLTFDFNHAPLTPAQVADVEKLVNERILDNATVSWVEVKHDHVKGRPDVMQFFGDKYGEWVRVVQIGGKPTGLDGYSMELCGGTHTRATGEIGLFRIVGENAIAAGVRRIEAIAGLEAWRRAGEELTMLKNVCGRLATPLTDLDKKIENMLAQQKDLEKQLLAMVQERAARAAQDILSRATTINGVPALIERFDTDGEKLQGVVNELKGQFKGVIVLGGVAGGAVALIASVSPDFTAKVQAGKIIQQIAPIVGGKGGGRPDNARGGGKDASKLDEALAKAKTLI